MYLKHKVFGKLFNIFTKFPINNNLISFIIDSNESFSSNLEYIKNEFESRGDFEFNYYYKDKLSINSLKKLATSRYVFLNDNFFPLAFMKFNNKSTVIQLWHAPGAFKKFGGSVENASMLKLISDNTDYLIITSKYIEDYYAEAFQIDKSKIKVLGLPRADYYFKNHNIENLRQNFNNKYNLESDKKIILYAPTFRENEEYNNVFNYLNEQELLLISDILITDYSSIMIEFALLNKPVIFFAYDLDNYMDNERGFYLDYKKDLPGPIVYSTEELVNTIKDGIDTSKLNSFIQTQFDDVDGNSSKRIVDFVLNEGEKNG